MCRTLQIPKDPRTEQRPRESNFPGSLNKQFAQLCIKAGETSAVGTATVTRLFGLMTHNAHVEAVYHFLLDDKPEGY